MTVMVRQIVRRNLGDFQLTTFTKFHENVQDSSQFINPFSICLYRVSILSKDIRALCRRKTTRKTCRASVEMDDEISQFVSQSSLNFARFKEPCSYSKHFICVYHFSFQDIRAEVAISSQNQLKIGSFGVPTFQGKNSKFLDVYFQIWPTSEHVGVRLTGVRWPPSTR